MIKSQPAHFLPAIGRKDQVVPKAYLLCVRPLTTGAEPVELQVRIGPERAAELGRTLLDWANKTDPAAALRGVGHVLEMR